VTLAHQAVDAKTNALTQVEAVLGQVVLENRICTRETLLTQRHVAQALGNGGGD
jgi:hypothetical protein